MRALLTGATGYVGRNLADALRAQGWQVLRCVRVPSGEPDTCALPDLDARSISALPLDCDAIFHLAGIAHRYGADEPPEAEYDRVNAQGSGALAAGARGRANAFVLVSSVAAVCSASHHVLTPDTPPRPTTPYGRSKLRAEQLVADEVRGSTTSVRIVRLPAVYGPGAPGALGQLQRWVARGRPLPSCASQVKRSVIYIQNATSVLTCAATHPQLAGQCIMPSDGPAPSVLTLAGYIASALGTRVRTVPMPMAALRAAAKVFKGGALERLLSSCEINDPNLPRLTGWTPPVTTEAGIRLAFGGAHAEAHSC